MNADDILVLLHEKYAPPAWSFFPQVPDGTGALKVRCADAAAMSLWPSRGLHLHGFEIKVSRGDWLRELKDPAKADAIAQYCDFWWIVASDKEVAQSEELPPAWGLMVVRGKQVVAVKQAEQRQDALAPDKPFLAGLLRRAHEGFVTQGQLRSARQAGIKEGEKRVNDNLKFDAERAEQELAHFKKALSEFEAKSGVEISKWDAGNMGLAVKRLMQMARNPEDCGTERGLRHVEEFLAKMLADVQKTRAAFEAARKSIPDEAKKEA